VPPLFLVDQRASVVRVAIVVSVSACPRLQPDQLLALALSRPAEALAQARAVLAADPSPADAAVAHQAAGVVLRDFGDITEAVAELRAAARFARAAADPARETDVLASLGVALVMAGKTRSGLATLERAVAGSTGVPAGQILIRRVFVLLLLGRDGEALTDARRAVDLLAGAGDLVWEARAYHHRAVASLAVGDTAQADQDYATCGELYDRCGQRLESASALQERGATAFARGDLPTALAHLDKAEAVVDELEIFEAELYVTKVAVLLAAGLHREALETAENAVERHQSHRGSMTRHAELLYCAALAAHAVDEPEITQRRATAALELFRRQGRPWWAARAELVLVEGVHAAGASSSTLLRQAGRVARHLDALDPERGVTAHLLTARIAMERHNLALGRAHLSAAAALRHRGMQNRSAGWLAQALLCRTEGRSRAMLAACDRGLRHLDLYLRTLGATELRVLATAQGAELAGVALRHAVDRQDARQVLEWTERWRATVLAVPPVRPGSGEAVDDELATELAALRTLSRRVETGVERGYGLDGLTRERGKLEAEVRRRVLQTPGAAAPLSARLRSAELLAHLDDAALVELTEVDGELHAVIAHAGRVRLRHVGPSAVATSILDHALFALRREQSGRGRRPLDLDGIGARLEGALLGGAVALLPDGPVVVVPTGRLHAVPWGCCRRCAGVPPRSCRPRRPGCGPAGPSRRIPRGSSWWVVRACPPGRRRCAASPRCTRTPRC
jgi:tetratricopeptide (TPR) repeat protein